MQSVWLTCPIRGHDTAGEQLEPGGAHDPLVMEVVRCLPNGEDELTKLAAGLRQQDRLAEAWLVAAEALRLFPNSVPLMGEQAKLHQACGDGGAAIHCLQRSLDKAPDMTGVRLDLIRQLLEQGQFQDAARELKELDRELLSPSEEFLATQLDLFMNVPAGAALRSDPEVNCFIDICRRSDQTFQYATSFLRTKGEHHWILEMLDQPPLPTVPWQWELERIQVLCDLGRCTEALDCIAQSTPRFHQYFVPLHTLGVTAHALGNLELAQQLLERAIQLEPNHAQAWYDLARVRRDRLDHVGYFDSLLEALERSPFHLKAQMSLGIQYLQLGDLASARQCFKRALALRPPSPAGYTLQGIINFLLGDPVEAEAAARRAIKIAPHHLAAHLNLAIVLLLLGRYEEGWIEYEWRLQNPNFALRRPNGIPLWDGETQIDELVVVAEQGVGDLVHFIRYGTYLAFVVPSVTIVVPNTLKALAEHSGFFNRVAIAEQSLNPKPRSAWIPLLSVPRLLHISTENVLWDGPYLKAPSKRVEHWKELFAGEIRAGLLVGLNWQGQSSTERDTLVGRSLPLEALAPLAGIESLRLASLQKGIGSEQLDSCSFLHRFVACQPEISNAWDFLDTLAILECCDLVITSDTCVAHLAGALGRPTWLLLQYIPDWRWGLQGTASHWYASLRLFRQRRHGDWAGVVQEVFEALTAFAGPT